MPATIARTQPPLPARLHILLAREAPSAVVFRRGPRQWVATFGWDRRTDQFQLGQWLKGRIYVERCDLSADGQYLLYFALDGKWHREASGTYTAISRAPWLKALALFPLGDTWGGGGVWTGPRSFWLQGHPVSNHATLRDSPLFQRDLDSPLAQGLDRRDPPDAELRLERGGWQFFRADELGRWERIIHLEKALPHGWTLRRRLHIGLDTAPGKGVEWFDHSLEHQATGQVVDGPDWEWAERDGDRLVWAARGCLFAAGLTPAGLTGQRTLHDFNPFVFEPRQAPY